LRWAYSAQQSDLLPELIAGKLQLALAYSEAAAGSNPAFVTTRAVRNGDEYILDGEKLMVLNGRAADYLLVTARSSDGERDPRGIEIFAVDVRSKGVTRRTYPTVDGLRAADIQFDQVRVPAGQRIGDPDENLDSLESVIDEAIIASAAEAVGAMEVLYKTTVEYANSREQFGSPLGKFQALQQRMVDMFMAHEQSKSLLYMAALRSQEGATWPSVRLRH
jgi:alkylation response protein AidB-like acyl-CoA dehydrogenase